MADPLDLAADTAPEALAFGDDGRTPNSRHPVLVYRDVLPRPCAAPAERLEASFAAHGWPAQWRGGVFAYHHYHANCHEALAVYAGEAELIVGGESGRPLRLHYGDVIILPAGTGHCLISASADFALTAAYPDGHGDWDLCRPRQTDHALALARIAHVPIPPGDPLTGPHGALRRYWTH